MKISFSCYTFVGSFSSIANSQYDAEVVFLFYMCVLLFFQYYGQNQSYSQGLDYMNMIFTGVFTVEFLLKLAAFRFKVRLPPGCSYISHIQSLSTELLSRICKYQDKKDDFIEIFQ